MTSSPNSTGPEIVVIGGSAGSLAALQAILPELPPTYPLAVVLVVHQSRYQDAADEHRLAHILARHCSLPVALVDDGGPVAGNAVHVCRPNYHTLLESNRIFALSTDEPVNHARPSIDVLFESAARAYRQGVIGMLLSGGGDDGASGLAAIRARGGIVACQDPADAAHDSLPRAGCQATTVDWIGPARLLGIKLASVVK